MGTLFWLGFESHANYQLLVEGEAVLDLSALEYGPSHQLDLPLRPAQDPFLAKKVRWAGGWKLPLHTQNLFLIAMKSHKTISDTGATRPSPWKAGGWADTGTDITRGIWSGLVWQKLEITQIIRRGILPLIRFEETEHWNLSLFC